VRYDLLVRGRVEMVMIMMFASHSEREIFFFFIWWVCCSLLQLYMFIASLQKENATTTRTRTHSTVSHILIDSIGIYNWHSIVIILNKMPYSYSLQLCMLIACLQRDALNSCTHIGMFYRHVSSTLHYYYYAK